MPNINAVGIVVVDPSLATIFAAPCAGTVVGADVGPAGSLVRADEAVLKIRSDTIRDRQMHFIQLLDTDDVDGFEAARGGLLALGMTERQVWSLTKRRRPSAFLSIKAPDAGFVSHVTASRRNVAEGATLFKLHRTTNLLVSVKIERELHAEINPSLPVFVRRQNWPRARANKVRWARRTPIPVSETHNEVWLTLDLATKNYQCGDRVAVLIPAPSLPHDQVNRDWLMPQRQPATAQGEIEAHPEMIIARQHGWTYKMLPRGAIRKEYGLEFSLGCPGSRSLSAVTESKKLALSGDRPKRKAASPYRMPYARAVYPRSAHRFPIHVSLSRWNERRIATTQAREWTFRSEFLSEAKVQKEQASEQLVHIVAPLAGSYMLTPRGINSFVDVGDVLATSDVSHLLSLQMKFLKAVQTENLTAIDAVRQELIAVGFPSHEIRKLEATSKPLERISVVSFFEGLIKFVAGSAIDICSGETLAVIDHMPSLLLRCNAPNAVLPTLSQALQVDLRRSSMHEWCSIGRGLPITEDSPHANREDWTQFTIPIPARALTQRWLDSLVTGNVVDVRLSTYGRDRQGVVVPLDSIIKIGASAELLVNTGLGELTPVSVTLGEIFQGEIASNDQSRLPCVETLVEIETGLASSEAVVRDLEELTNNEPLLRAVIMGFWNPGDKVY